MVTTRYGAPPSPDRTSPPLPVRLVSSSPQPVVVSNASPATNPTHLSRFRKRFRRINVLVPRFVVAAAALMHQSERLPYRLQRHIHTREDNVAVAGLGS